METPICILVLLIIFAGSAFTIFKLRNVPIAFRSVLVRDVKYKSFGMWAGGVQTTTYDMGTLLHHRATVGELLRWPLLHWVSLCAAGVVCGGFVAFSAMGEFEDPWSIFAPILAFVGCYGMVALLFAFANLDRYRELVVCRDRGLPFNFHDQRGLKGITIVPESRWPSFAEKLEWPGKF
jgi:hypothetical protein